MTAVVDAVIVSAVAVAAWEGSKYVNDVMEKKSGGKEDKKMPDQALRIDTRKAKLHNKSNKQKLRQRGKNQK